MAVRLQMKLGVISEQDRSLDSPDTIVVVEPTIGAIARSKGHLYLIVTSTIASARAQEATQLAAETIRGEYYYDESAGIRVCIEKAIASANKRLSHQRERLGLHGTDENGPIGIGIAVVRGNELYVVTIGPAEAYLIRQARLSTLPDPHRERGLPTRDLEPDVWRGEISVGDSLVLVSPNVMARLGADELKDAMVTLHPQPAMEHLHHRFLAADGSGSDAMIAFEATEVAATHRSRTLVPVRPAEPLAGAPDRSPIPLADNVTGGVAAVQASAGRARDAAGGAVAGGIRRLQDLLPRRRTAPGIAKLARLHPRRLRLVPQRAELPVGGVEIADPLQQIIARRGQSRRGIALHRQRPAKCHRYGCGKRHRLAAGELGKQPVHPAILDPIGRRAAALKHVLAVEMGSFAIGRGNRLDEQRLLGRIEARGAAERRVQREHRVDLRPARQVRRHVTAKAGIGRVTGRGERRQAVSGTALNDEQESFVGPRGGGKGDPGKTEHRRSGAPHGNELAAIQHFYLRNISGDASRSASPVAGLSAREIAVRVVSLSRAPSSRGARPRASTMSPARIAIRPAASTRR